MIVKIGNQIFNSNEEPIMIVFDEAEKELISSMIPENMKFCSFPEDSNVRVIETFMKLPEEDENQITMAIDKDAFKIPAEHPGD